MNEKNLTTFTKASNGFNIKEVIPLLNHECIREKHRNHLPSPSVNLIGIVCGILTMNSEIELLVQFPEGIEQLSKSEFKNRFLIISE